MLRSAASRTAFVLLIVRDSTDSLNMFLSPDCSVCLSVRLTQCCRLNAARLWQGITSRVLHPSITKLFYNHLNIGLAKTIHEMGQQKYNTPL